MFREEAITV